MELDRGKKRLPYHLPLRADYKHTMFHDFIIFTLVFCQFLAACLHCLQYFVLSFMLQNIKNALLRWVQNKLVTKLGMWLFLN